MLVVAVYKFSHMYTGHFNTGYELLSKKVWLGKHTTHWYAVALQGKTSVYKEYFFRSGNKPNPVVAGQSNYQPHQELPMPH